MVFRYSMRRGSTPGIMARESSASRLLMRLMR